MAGSVHIREVWNDNLEAEFKLINKIVDDYPFIAMDTEFPGVVLQTVEAHENRAKSAYQQIKVNVDILKLIQCGLTFADANGNLPTCGTDDYFVWQFNFREFEPDEDIHAPESIKLLQESGIDFARNKESGVDVVKFGALLMSSGAVLNPDVWWVTFHGAYDVAYLLKLLTGRDLPETLVEFRDKIKEYFPVLYDIKHMLRYHEQLHGGLSKIAEKLQVERVGDSHQAGSDSLVTSRVFFKVKEEHLNRPIAQYKGVLSTLEVEN